MLLAGRNTSIIKSEELGTAPAQTGWPHCIAHAVLALLAKSFMQKGIPKLRPPVHGPFSVGFNIPHRACEPDGAGPAKLAAQRRRAYKGSGGPRRTVTGRGCGGPGGGPQGLAPGGQ